MIDFTSLNYLAILVALVANQAIGALWYSVLFGKPWMAEVGIDPDSIDKKDATRAMISAIIFAIIGFMLLAVFVQLTGATGWSGGAFIGFLIALFAAVPTATNYAYEGRSNKLFLINAFYPIVSYTIGGIIIGSWL